MDEIESFLNEKKKYYLEIYQAISKIKWFERSSEMVEDLQLAGGVCSGIELCLLKIKEVKIKQEIKNKTNIEGNLNEYASNI